MMDEIFEDIFVYFKDKLLPEKDLEPAVSYDVDFCKVMTKQSRATISVDDKDQMKAIKSGGINE